VRERGRESACVFGAWVQSRVRIEGARGTHVSQASQKSASLTGRDELLDATERGEENISNCASRFF
jgi:hypothetical protein